MYQYSDRDRRFLRQRIVQFQSQLERRLNGGLSEDQFRPLRLQNGLYQEKHAPMLRVAIPYGELNATQLRKLAEVARRYDRGYGHFTTRQNIQFNWPRLDDIAEILTTLAEADMHAVQTSGNVIRNITTDFMAGVAVDEAVDPRLYCELIRQWSAAHPEFSWLPRKFKIAVSAGEADRAAVKVHDIGLRIRRDRSGCTRIAVWVGGGLGRTPLLAQCLRKDLMPHDLLSYLEAILRVYNLQGRRDNLYKSRIKILVKQVGIDRFREWVETEWQAIRNGELRLSDAEISAIGARFDDPRPEPIVEPGDLRSERELQSRHPQYAAWVRHNVLSHRIEGYVVAVIALKRNGRAAGDLDADEMESLATLSERFSLGRIRTTQSQNLAFPYVRRSNLFRLWRALSVLGLAEGKQHLASDIVACPGSDFCSLANAATISVEAGIRERIARLRIDEKLGPVSIKLSGCVNACGHHHIADIGILGVEKNGEHWYQVTLAGNGGNGARIGQRLGAAIRADRIASAVECLLLTWSERRLGSESLIETIDRIGLDPFREKIYAPVTQRPHPTQSLAACAG